MKTRVGRRIARAARRELRAGGGKRRPRGPWEAPVLPVIVATCLLLVFAKPQLALVATLLTWTATGAALVMAVEILQSLEAGKLTPLRSFPFPERQLVELQVGRVLRRGRWWLVPLVGLPTLNVVARLIERLTRTKDVESVVEAGLMIGAGLVSWLGARGLGSAIALLAWSKRGLVVAAASLAFLATGAVILISAATMAAPQLLEVLGQPILWLSPPGWGPLAVLRFLETHEPLALLLLLAPASLALLPRLLIGPLLRATSAPRRSEESVAPALPAAPSPSDPAGDAPTAEADPRRSAISLAPRPREGDGLLERWTHAWCSPAERLALEALTPNEGLCITGFWCVAAVSALLAGVLLVAWPAAGFWLHATPALLAAYAGLPLASLLGWHAGGLRIVGRRRAPVEALLPLAWATVARGTLKATLVQLAAFLPLGLGMAAGLGLVHGEGAASGLDWGLRGAVLLAAAVLPPLIALRFASPAPGLRQQLRRLVWGAAWLVPLGAASAPILLGSWPWVGASAAGALVLSYAGLAVFGRRHARADLLHDPP